MTTQDIPETISSIPQPPRETWGFAEELRTRETRRFHAPRGMPEEGEADLRKGVRVRMSFPDARDVLRTAVSDLNDFFRETGIPAGNGPYEIRMEQDSGVTPWDSFEIEVAPERCVIRAALAEGGYAVDKKKIVLSSPLREAGEYEVELRLFEGVNVKVGIRVEAVPQ